MAGQFANRERMRGFVVVSALVLLLPMLTGCGDEPHSASPPAAILGTSVSFDLDADLQQAEHYYDFPTTSDLRLTPAGMPDVSGFPVVQAIVGPVKTIAGLRRGFPVTPACFFRFDAALAERDALAPIAAERDAPLLLIDIDAGSPERGRLFPTVATVPPPDAYVPPHLLAVAAMPGVVLHPKRTYAFVVMRHLGDGLGEPLGQPLALAQLRAGVVPHGARGSAAAMLYAPLWDVLRDLDIDTGNVAAASIFTTGDVAADLGALSDVLLDRYDVTIDDLHVDPDDGAQHERFCELHATVRFPQFQHGTPPFDREGLFVYGEDGLPLAQRLEDVPLTVTLPRTAMPDTGYPLAFYFHGTGGLSTQVVDRGPVSEPGGTARQGEGPAHVLAAHGIATVAAALPLNPQRLPGGPGQSMRSYLNLRNLAAYPDTFRQGTIEQRLLLEAVGRLRIAPETVDPCTGLSRAAGVAAYQLNTERIALLGQSLGGQFTNQVGALEPRVIAVVPTGSGGYWSLVTLLGEILPGVDSRNVIGLLLDAAQPLSHLHPALQLVQMGFEPADPVVFAPRLARDPLPQHPARHIYQPVGRDDPGFPIPIYDLMALASGTQQAGAVEWASLQDVLASDGRGGILPYPQIHNQRSLDGRPFTAVVVQYAGDGILSPHHIVAQLDAVKFQYGCFIESALQGAATVLTPQPLGKACR